MQAEISPELLEELRRRAREQGRPERELLDEAVKSYLERPGSLAELFEGIDQGQREEAWHYCRRARPCASLSRNCTPGGVSADPAVKGRLRPQRTRLRDHLREGTSQGAVAPLGGRRVQTSP